MQMDYNEYLIFWGIIMPIEFFVRRHACDAVAGILEWASNDVGRLSEFWLASYGAADCLLVIVNDERIYFCDAPHDVYRGEGGALNPLIGRLEWTEVFCIDALLLGRMEKREKKIIYLPVIATDNNTLHSVVVIDGLSSQVLDWIWKLQIFRESRHSKSHILSIIIIQCRQKRTSILLNNKHIIGRAFHLSSLHLSTTCSLCTQYQSS